MPVRLTKDSVGIIILAAGASSRMGQPKQLLVYEGQTLLQRAIHSALATEMAPVVVVLGANATQIRASIAHLPVLVVENPNWAEGMASSIRVGLLHVQGKSRALSAALLMLCDQPLLTTQLLADMVECYASSGSPLVAAQYEEQVGVPALFDQSLFSELLALQGAQGAKQLIQRHQPHLVCVPFSGGSFDIDTPEDFINLNALKPGFS